MDQKIQEAFLSLVRLGIGHYEANPQGTVNWTAIKALAMRQGLNAVVLDGIEKLPESQRLTGDTLLDWVGEVLQDYEYRFESYCRTIAELAGVYKSHGIKMMVLKGYACSLDWPRPEHRPCGDIDIWLFGKQKEADAIFVKEGMIIDKSHHHHTIYYWRDFTVENHYDFVNVHAERSSGELEKILKELGQDDSHYVEVYGERVFLPSPNLHALFLIRHMVSHFAAAEITLRHVIDWAFFVRKHTKEIDWVWLLGVLEAYHMKEFFNMINAICVDNLGFSPEIFPKVHFLPELKDRVFVDILDPKYGAEEPVGFLPRILYKYRRWQGNAWKQRLCYKESRWEIFWTLLLSHIIGPKN